ncbi:MAG: hypothetical protein C0392_06615 [Syntrophus sp. (in: bacteria)]|nr:hypothetical protein [Syntrophus sp. (in: bacteria)]
MKIKERSGSDGTMNKKRLTQLIKTLRDGDTFTREKAFEALLAAPDKAVVEAVTPLLQEKDTGMRMMILEILNQMGNLHIESVISMLDDDNEDIRVYGLEVLMRLKNPDTIPHLIRKMGGDYENVRNAACMALGEFDDDRAVDALMGAMKDEDWIAFSAILSLGKIGRKRSVPALFEVFKEGREEISLAACEALIDFRDPDILDKIIETLKGWDEKKRYDYIQLMLEKGEEDIFIRMKERISDELFTHLLNSVRYENRRSLQMIKLLAQFKTLATCDTILDTIARLDPDSDEFSEVLELLVDLKDVWAEKVADYGTRAEEYLLPIIKACSIGGIKINEDVLLEIFRSSSVDVRREVIRNINAIVDGAGYHVIEEAIHDTDGHIQGDAIAAAGIMGMNKLKKEIGKIAKEGFPDVRAKALKAMLELDITDAMALIEHFVNKGTIDDKKVFLAAAGALDKERNFPLLTKLLRDDDEGIRKAAIGAIGNFLEDERYMDILRALLKNEEIPHEALKIVKEKKLTVFKDRLIDLFMDSSKGMWTRYYALSALDAFRDHALFDLFVKGLEDESSLIKIGSLNALAGLEDPKALLHIALFTQSDDEDIRSTAEFAISRLENL